MRRQHLRRATNRAKRDVPTRPVPQRMVLTMLDQGFSSASNFAVTVVAARLAGAAGLGGFSFAYVCWQLVVVVHRSLVTDPMTIENDAYQPDSPSRLRRGFAADAVFATTSAVLFALGGVALLAGGDREFGIGLLSFAPWLVPLVLQDYCRWLGFMHRRPGMALVNDSVFNLVFAAALVVIVTAHWHSVPAIAATWGLGGLAGALLGLWQFALRPMIRGGLATLRSRIHFSKWIAANQATVWGSAQATSLVAGFILGPAVLGYLRAAQTLVYGPTLVLTQAGGSIGLPEASNALAKKGWPGLRRVARVVSAAAVLGVLIVGIVVFAFGRHLLGIVYGHSFSHYWVASDLFVVAQVFWAVGFGAVLVLKASRQTRPLFAMSVMSMIVALTATSVMAHVYGVSGAAGSAAVSSAIYAAGLLYSKRRVRIRLQRGEIVPAPMPAPAGVPSQPEMTVP